MNTAPLFSTQTRRRVAYAILAMVLLVCAGAAVWVVDFQHDLPLAILSPAFVMWIAVPFIILGSVAREEKALREGRQPAVPVRRTWIMLIFGIFGVILVALGAVFMVRH
jgi:hypothetical protein